MIEPEISDCVPKRTMHKTMHKVRKQALVKKATSSEINEYKPDPLDNIMPNKEPLVIFPAIAMIERNRRLCLGVRFHSIFRSIDRIDIENNGAFCSVKVNFSCNMNYGVKPWRYIVKRLESYGDLNIALCAKLIANYYEIYEANMMKYYATLKQYSQYLPDFLRRSQIEVDRIIKRIEMQHSMYLKGTFFANADSVDMVSVTYGEGVLKEIGMPLEGFPEWIKNHGTPHIVDKHSLEKLNYLGLFLDGLLNGCKPLEELPVHEVTIRKINGQKSLFKVKYFIVLRPEENGIRAYTFLIFYCEEKDQQSLIEDMHRLKLKSMKEI